VWAFSDPLSLKPTKECFYHREELTVHIIKLQPRRSDPLLMVRLSSITDTSKTPRQQALIHNVKPLEKEAPAA